MHRKSCDEMREREDENTRNASLNVYISLPLRRRTNTRYSASRDATCPRRSDAPLARAAALSCAPPIGGACRHIYLAISRPGGSRVRPREGELPSCRPVQAARARARRISFRAAQSRSFRGCLPYVIFPTISYIGLRES